MQKQMKCQEKFIQKAVLAGSRGYGLHEETSDYDHRGFYLLNVEDYLGIDEGHLTKATNDYHVPVEIAGKTYVWQKVLPFNDED